MLGEIVDDLMLNLVVVFEARKIKGVTLLQATEATKHLVIYTRHQEKSTLIQIEYRCVAPVWAGVRSMFAHSIFKGSSSKEE